jgi:hypothetical protein
VPNPSIQNFPRNERNRDVERLRKMLNIPGGFVQSEVLRCREDFTVLPGMKGLFSKGEKVILKGRTFQVVHVTSESVMLEPVPFVLDNGFTQK